MHPVVVAPERHPQLVQVGVEQGHVGTHAERDVGGVLPGDAGADDDDLGVGDAADAAHQHAAAALGLHQRVGADLRREAAGDLGHRVEQRQPARGQLHGLVGDAGDLALQQLLGQRLVGGEVQVGEERQPLAHPVVLLGDRLLDLEHHVDAAVGAPRLVGVGDDRRAGRDVLLVADRRARRPAPCWTKTSWPCATSSCTPIGVIATRYSWFLTSFGTPTFTCCSFGDLRHDAVAARAYSRGRRDRQTPADASSTASAVWPSSRTAASTASSSSANGTQPVSISASSCCGSKSPRPDLASARGPGSSARISRGDARRGVRRARCVHSVGLEPGLLDQLALGDARAGPRRRRRSSPAGSCDAAASPTGCRYCHRQNDPVLVVDGEDHRRRRGARRTSRRNGSSSGCPGGWIRSARSVDHPAVAGTGRSVGRPATPRARRRARATRSVLVVGSRRRPVSSIGNRSSFCRSIAAPTRPANSGCGRVGRERSSGCAWVAT